MKMYCGSDNNCEIKAQNKVTVVAKDLGGTISQAKQCFSRSTPKISVEELSYPFVQNLLEEIMYFTYSYTYEQPTSYDMNLDIFLAHFLIFRKA